MEPLKPWEVLEVHSGLGPPLEGWVDRVRGGQQSGVEGVLVPPLST